MPTTPTTQLQPMARDKCRNCGHTSFTRDYQTSSGDIVCTECGTVQEENPIVSEVQFGEASNGAATVHGSMVSKDLARANLNMRNAMESREQTLLSAKRKIRTLANAMRIPEYIVESASGWFKLALVQNFVQGRRSQNVVAACLYVACRHEKTPHLLIDFSSRLQLSVYSLGSTYLKLVRALQIQKLPLADPSLFIQHFAERLAFGEHTAKVCRDAAKIAHRMASDWIYEGRRPAGIAGACLLLAARMNNFRRTHAEIVSVARVGEETIQKRLNEFKKTTSGTLSVAEFRTSDNTNDSLPPSFHNNRRIEKKLRQVLHERERQLRRYRNSARESKLYDALFTDDPGSRPGSAEPELRDRSDRSDRHSERQERRSERRLGREDRRWDRSESQPENGRYPKKQANFAVSQDPTDPDLFLPEEDSDSLSDASEPPEDPKDATFEPESTSRLGGLGDKSIPRLKSGKSTRRFASSTGKDSSKADPLLRSVLAGGDLTEEDLEVALDRILDGQKRSYNAFLYKTPLEESRNSNDTEDINRPRNLVKNNPTTAELLLIVPDDEQLDSADDDDEVESFTLSELELKEKEKIWTALNHDFLIAQEKRRLKMEADELTGNTSGQSKKRRRVKEPSAEPSLSDPAVVSAINQLGEGGRPITPAESAKMLLQKRMFSKKLNYDSIGDLFDQS